MIPRFDQIYTFTSPQRVPVIQRTSSDCSRIGRVKRIQYFFPIFIISID